MPLVPRFDIKTLLLIFTGVALWLSTFTGYSLASDLRNLIIYSVFLVAGLKAFCLRGRRQVFWVGFFSTMLLFLFASSGNTPQARLGYFIYTSLRSTAFGGDISPFDSAAMSSIGFLVVMLGSTAMGYVGKRIYDQSQEPEKH